MKEDVSIFWYPVFHIFSSASKGYSLNVLFRMYVSESNCHVSDSSWLWFHSCGSLLLVLLKVYIRYRKVYIQLLVGVYLGSDSLVISLLDLKVII